MVKEHMDIVYKAVALLFVLYLVPLIFEQYGIAADNITATSSTLGGIFTLVGVAIIFGVILYAIGWLDQKRKSY